MLPAPRKRFGQHFLIDQQIIERILLSVAPDASDHLIEIGPGQGALTFALLKKIPHLEAIEIDRDLINYLKTKTKHLGNLVIYAEDVLTTDFAALKKDERLLKIIGNLPYNISTPLIFHLLSFAPIIKSMFFMVQKEVGKRIAAKPDSVEYGRLSVMVQYYCHTEILFDVSPQAFAPPPQVHSCVIQLTPHQPLPYVAKNEALFREIVKQAFNQKRKTLRNSLKNFISDSDWTHLALSSHLRPENLSVSDFVELANIVLDLNNHG